MANGYVYIVVSEGQPNLCKIGFTDRDPSIRVRELDNSGSPFPLREHRRWKVWNAREHEQVIHSKLQNSRLRKEWFLLTADEAAALIDEIVDELNQPWRPTPSELERQRKEAEWAERARLAREAEAQKQQRARVERLRFEEAAFWREYDGLDRAWEPVIRSIATLIGLGIAWSTFLPSLADFLWKELIVSASVFFSFVLLAGLIMDDLPKALCAPKKRKRMEASDTFKLGRPDPTQSFNPVEPEA